MSKTRKTTKPAMPANPVERYCRVSLSILSTARRFGRATVSGSLYYYNPVADELIRDDVLAREAKWYVIREGVEEEKDGYLATADDAKEAVRIAKADRSGRLCGVFGPGGWIGGFFRDGRCPDEQA